MEVVAVVEVLLEEAEVQEVVQQEVAQQEVEEVQEEDILVVIIGGGMVLDGLGTQVVVVDITTLIGIGGGLVVVDLVGEVAAAFHPQLLLFQIN